jgi:uncharacterized protein (TIGR02596 family)
MKTSRAFSLVELLVVIVIIAILAIVSLPALAGIGASTKLNSGGQVIGDLVVLARQEASAKNRDVEVRFVRIDNSGSPRAVQLWIANDSGTVLSPLSRLQVLPDAVILSTNGVLSPLIAGPLAIKGTANFGSYGSCAYSAFRLRAGGKLETSVGTNNFLTLHMEYDREVPPQNFHTIRVNPVTGRVTTHRR